MLVKKLPTIKDIARETGVSTTTVINVLKNRTLQTSKATAEKVLLKAKELGYVRNLTAASLVGNRSHAFALIITRAYSPATPEEKADINPFYGEFILRLELEARKNGLMLNLFGGFEDDYVNFVLQRNLEAAVLMGIHKPDLPLQLTRRGIPVILIDSPIEDHHYTSIRSDDFKAGELAAEYLIRKGRRVIAFVGNTQQPPNTGPSQRLRGAQRTCQKAGVKFHEINCYAAFHNGVASAPEIIKLECDGIFAAADTLAAGILNGLHAAGKQVPQDVAVVGYDNLIVASMTYPALTTIDPDMNSKIHKIVEAINLGKPGKTFKTTPRLVQRESA